MPQSFRLPEILDIARSEGKVTVDNLAARFGVSVQTIRRDLSDLADAGRLERVHGGAVLPSGVSNIAYEERRSLNHAAKSAIARSCAALIPDGASVFLNIGTTTEAVAHELSGHRDLMVMTNNMNVAGLLAGHLDCDVIVTGGTLRRSDGGLTGDLAVQTVEQFRFDIAVIGCSAIDPSGDMLDFDLQEVQVSRAVIRQSRQVILAADHSKFDRSAPVRIAGLDQVDVFVTDRMPDAAFTAHCHDWKTEIHLTD